MVRTLWRRKKPEKERKFHCKKTASSSKHYYFLEYTNLVFRRSPDRGIHQVKKQTKICFFAFVRACQLITGTYHVCHVCAEISSHPSFVVHSDIGRRVVSLSCVIVEYPCLASPGPSKTILSHLGVLACVLGFCLQGYVSIASIELLPASLPEIL